MKFTDEDIEEANKVGEPGVYEAEVATVEEKLTKSNDPMWALKFKDAKTGDFLCYDNLAFSKNGKGMAFLKLKNLGVEKVDGFYEVESENLVGSRVNLTLVEDTYKGKTKLVVDVGAENCGYESDIPF